MSQTQTNFLKPTSLHPQPSSSSSASSSSNPSKQNMCKPITIAKTEPEKMAAFPPVEIGTRGTVGSLVLKEIEYFNQLELGGRVNSKTMAQSRVKDMACSSSTTSLCSKPNFGSLSATQKKKKRGSKLLPSMCSMVEVSESNNSIGISGFCYRNLKTDVKNLQA